MRSSSSVTNDWRSRRSGRNRNYSARTCIPSHFSYRIRRSNFRSRFEITELLIRGSRNYSAGSRMTHAHVRNLQRDRRFHHVLKPHNLLSRLCVLRTPSLWTTVRATISVEEGQGHPRGREHPSSEPAGGCSREKSSYNAFFPVYFGRRLFGLLSARRSQ